MEYHQATSSKFVCQQDTILRNTEPSYHQQNSRPNGFEKAVELASNKRYEEQRSPAYYNWRTYAPLEGGILQYARWLMVGESAYSKQSDEERHSNIRSLARCLLLLRKYKSINGMPEQGGQRDQEYVLREVYKDLYAGGTPIWALEPVMIKAAEGLTGKQGINFLLLPRKTFICAPSSGATSMFSTERGFCIHKLDAMEQVVVRLASFASNTNGVCSIPSRLPDSEELENAAQGESSRFVCDVMDKNVLAAEILALGSHAEGLFSFVNKSKQSVTASGASSTRPLVNDNFWEVDNTTCELFSRLAAIEAMEYIDSIDADRKVLYSPEMNAIFRLFSSAGACAVWFNGSWYDMGIAGALALLVAFMGSSSVLTRQERIVFEVVASFAVGLSAGLIALNWPDHTCFAAMAIAGVLDILQGFRIVYAIIEVMSKHTVAGGADFLEGILFTGLIAYFLKFGQYTAGSIMGDPDNSEFLQCRHGIDPLWYFLFLPLAAVSWSGLFMPNHSDLPLMGLHGILGYIVNWGVTSTFQNENVNNFVASLCVTLSAGIISRFTGRQAVGNTVAGIYVLLPGAYLVNALYSSETDGFFSNIILRAVIIGIGAWTGTMLCSPTVLGTTRGLLTQKRSLHGEKGERLRDKLKPNAMLFF